jgi:DNA processing protein
MGTDALVRLQYAIAATRFGGGQRTIATRVRTGGLRAFETGGLRAFEQILFALQSDERHQVQGQAGDLSNEGVDAILLGQPDYPEALG